MADKVFVGSGWGWEHGVNISIKKEKIVNLPVDKFGNIRLQVNKRKEADEKSKSTHYVAVDTHNQNNG